MVATKRFIALLIYSYTSFTYAAGFLDSLNKLIAPIQEEKYLLEIENMRIYRRCTEVNLEGRNYRPEWGTEYSCIDNHNGIGYFYDGPAKKINGKFYPYALVKAKYPQYLSNRVSKKTKVNEVKPTKNKIFSNDASNKDANFNASLIEIRKKYSKGNIYDFDYSELTEKLVKTDQCGKPKDSTSFLTCVARYYLVAKNDIYRAYLWNLYAQSLSPNYNLEKYFLGQVKNKFKGHSNGNKMWQPKDWYTVNTDFTNIKKSFNSETIFIPLEQWADQANNTKKEKSFASTNKSSFSNLWNQNGGNFISQEQDQNIVKFQKSKEDIHGPSVTLNSEDKVEIFDANHTISGIISDKSGLAELRINGQSVIFNDDGKFNKKLYFAIGSSQVDIEVFDTFGNKTTKTISISRKQPIVKNSDKKLIPPTKRIYKNPNAVAVLIGLEKYENMPEAQWAESDAKIFYDYAKNVLGVSEDRIKVLVNENSKYIDFWDNLEFWLNSKVSKNETDIYFYFAGHGLVSEDGLNTYLMPYDARTNLLNRTAISRKEVINFLDNLNPRSATLFLDTCYSGNAKGGAKTLVASRGLRVVKKDQIDNIPSNFTVFSAASSDETAISHPTQKNGLFSYWLMRGMDGDADLNKDEKITNAELHQYVNQKVVKTAIAEGQKQTPQIYGNNERVITRW